MTLPSPIICFRQLWYGSFFAKRLCVSLNLKCSVNACVSHLVLISAADIHDFSCRKERGEEESDPFSREVAFVLVMKS